MVPASRTMTPRTLALHRLRMMFEQIASPPPAPERPLRNYLPARADDFQFFTPEESRRLLAPVPMPVGADPEAVDAGHRSGK